MSDESLLGLLLRAHKEASAQAWRFNPLSKPSGMSTMPRFAYMVRKTEKSKHEGN